MPPRESEFPGFQKALDPDTVLESLNELNDTPLHGVSIVDVRYRPDNPCWILYRLKGRAASGRSTRQLVSARLLRGGESCEPLPEPWAERYQALDEKLLRSPFVEVVDIPMVVYAYPIDVSLPGLFDASDPAHMKRHLNAIWTERKMRVLDVEVRALGYTPGARAAFSYEVMSESRETGVPELRRFIGKMHAKKPASRLFADAWALWRAGKGRLAVAPPVGYVGAPVDMTLQEKVGGVRLGGVVDEPHFVKRVRRTARVLATMHGLTPPLSSRRKPADEAASVHRWAGVLTAIRPELARTIERLRDRLSGQIEARALLSSPIHADFHHTNVLVDEDRVRVIDLDEMAFGDPMVDVGRFLASLRVPARRAFGNIFALHDAGEAFLEEYLKRAGGDERRARLFEAASLLIAAGSSFRIQRPGWEEEVSLLVAESERLLQRAGRNATIGGGVDRKPALEKQERVGWASDPIFMQASLDPYVREIYGAQLTSCRVESRGPSRWRYALRGRRGDEKWRVSVEGVLGGSGGPGLVRRLGTLNEKLEGATDAPLLPRPVAYLRLLSLLVWEVPAGTRFSSLLETEDGVDAASLLARALAALHRTRADLDTFPLERELRNVRKKVESLRETRASELLEEVEQRSYRASAKVGPVMRTVHPNHVLCADGKIAFDRIENVRLSHPLIDTGDFLARLALLGLSRGASDRVEDAAASFRTAYSQAGGASRADIATFEAGALLRLASGRVEEVNLPASLVRRAEKLLSA